MNDVLTYLKKDLLKKDDIVVVAVSGGPDSMALLSLLLQVRSELAITIVCAHVNHNVREVSFKEKEFVEAFCKEHNIIFEYYLIEQYHADNFHQDARNIRYQYFESLIEKYRSTYLFTAHHGDDLMETMLMRMVRGSILKGYAGFPKESNQGNYWLVRPLIHKTKEELFTYDQQNNIPYVIDGSNEKDVYTRNRFRKYVLPLLKKENPIVHHKFYQLSEELLEVNQFLSRQVNGILNQVYQDKKLNLKEFVLLDNYLKKCVLEHILQDVYQEDVSKLTVKHMNSLRKLVDSPVPHLELSFPNQIVVTKSYDVISFSRKEEKISYCMPLEKSNLLPNGHKIVFEEDIDSSNDTCQLDSFEIHLPLFIRTRKKGDRVAVKGLTGTKKLKDIFINEKIPLKERDSWPILVDSSNQILWVPGLKKTKFDKTNEEKYDIILRYY